VAEHSETKRVNSFLAGLRLGIVFRILIHLEQIASGRSIVAALFGQNAPN
jgi:hypothetical protein